MRVAALVAAAGLGGRMGFPKILLARDDGTLLLEVHLQALVAVGAAPLLVTLPPTLSTDERHAITRRVAALGGVVTDNPHMERGLLGSVQAVLPGLATSDFLCVLPVDTLPVEPSVLRALWDAAALYPHTFVRPRCGDATGHPLLVPRVAFSAVTGDLPGGLRTLLGQAAPLVEVDVVSQACCQDANTPQAAGDAGWRRVTSRQLL